MPIGTASQNLRFGLTQAQLEAAFNKIKNPSHWKDRIDAVIEADDWDHVEKAVIYFTGSVPQVVEKQTDGKLRIKADGYWMAVGA